MDSNNRKTLELAYNIFEGLFDYFGNSLSIRDINITLQYKPVKVDNRMERKA